MLASNYHELASIYSSIFSEGHFCVRKLAFLNANERFMDAYFMYDYETSNNAKFAQVHIV